MKLVALSGSLSPKSANSALLRSAAQLDDLATILIWDDLADLPYFSPGGAANHAVTSLRRVLAEADAVWISTPEYAGGMPGALKNALDWLVESGELYGKRVVVTSAAPNVERGHNARRWVQEVVRMQGATVVDSFSIAIPPGTPPTEIAGVAETVVRRVASALEATDRADFGASTVAAE